MIDLHPLEPEPHRIPNMTFEIPKGKTRKGRGLFLHCMSTRGLEKVCAVGGGSVREGVDEMGCGCL